jgi:hypothetical protein
LTTLESGSWGGCTYYNKAIFLQSIIYNATMNNPQVNLY